MQRLAARLGGLSGWRRAALALAAGALAAAALPPYYLLPLLPPAFVALLWLLEGARRPLDAAGVGWLFGFGHFLVALHWVGHAFLIDAERFGALMPFAVAALAGGLALFPAAAAALSLAGPPGWPRLLALAAGWVLMERARGWLLTGFPWDPLGLVWFVSDASAQGIAMAGVFGMSLVTLLAALAPARLGRRRDLPPVLLLLALVPLLFAGGHLRLAAARPAEVPGLTLRLVQGNVPQDEKWRSDARLDIFRRYLALSGRPGIERTRLLLWPETATPFFLAEEPAARRAAAALLAPEGFLLTGAPRRESAGGRTVAVWNSLLALSPTGEVVRVYDKHHLVPFGEYLPFRALLSRLGLDKLAVGSLDYSAGEGPAVWRLPGVPALQPLICYEAIFPREVGRPRPQWLLNVTNDAWFGSGAGPQQHLAHARARAIELGVPLVRVANTGISAVIDPWGRLLGRIDLGVAGVLDATLPRALPPTPYVKLRGLWLVVPALLLLFFLFRRVVRGGE